MIGDAVTRATETREQNAAVRERSTLGARRFGLPRADSVRPDAPEPRRPVDLSRGPAS